MKKIVLSLLLITSTAVAFNFANAQLIQDFMSLVNKDLASSDANLLGLVCADESNGPGIICTTDLEFFDADQNGGRGDICNEVSSYSGGDTIKTICSTCDHAIGKSFYKDSCSIEREEVQNYVADELITILEKEIYFAHIAAYEKPKFQASFNTENGFIELYKLNYTENVYGKGVSQTNSEQDSEDEITGTNDVCEYIIYNPAEGNYDLTGVTCNTSLSEVTTLLNL